jgi:hypothetical protein
VIDKNGIVYFADMKGGVYAVSSVTRKLVWSALLPGKVFVNAFMPLPSFDFMSD